MQRVCRICKNKLSKDEEYICKKCQENSMSIFGF